MVSVNIVSYSDKKDKKQNLFCMVQVCLKFCFVHMIKSIKLHFYRSLLWPTFTQYGAIKCFDWYICRHYICDTQKSKTG